MNALGAPEDTKGVQLFTLLPGPGHASIKAFTSAADRLERKV